jgi:high affinity Mn2+ porin
MFLTGWLLLAALALPAPDVSGTNANDAAPPAAVRAADWSVHVQSTYQLQGHGAFDSPYQGRNSFQDRKETRGSVTATLFVGRRVWEGGEVYVNPELAGGQGLSRVLGLASPPNGETYRVDSTQVKPSLARLFLRQTWSLGEATDPVEDDQNQVAGRRSARRVVLTAGKFSVTDVFDANSYAHDPRTQFNNWSLWANAAWDYPADTRGYTWGFALEEVYDAWAVRLGSFLEPQEANGEFFDHDVRRAHGDVVELEHDHQLGGRAGAVRLLAFVNHARMGDYGEALVQAAAGPPGSPPVVPDVIATRRPGRVKYGFGLNAEQAITADCGAFLRAGWNDGHTESWAFTEVERTLTAGLSAAGPRWRRPADRVGLALGWNGIDREHQDYLAAGGYGFMLGDGRLSYAPERLVDAYYSLAAGKALSLSLEAQRFADLAFNRDRGPVTVFGARLHFQL